MAPISSPSNTQVQFGLSIRKKTGEALAATKQHAASLASATFVGKKRGAALILAGFLGGLGCSQQAYKLSGQSADCFRLLADTPRLRGEWEKWREQQEAKDLKEREEDLKKNPSKKDDGWSPPNYYLTEFTETLIANCDGLAYKNKPTEKKWWGGAIGSSSLLLLGIAGLLGTNRRKPASKATSDVPLETVNAQPAKNKPAPPNKPVEEKQDKRESMVVDNITYFKVPGSSDWKDEHGNSVYARRTAK